MSPRTPVASARSRAGRRRRRAGTAPPGRRPPPGADRDRRGAGSRGPRPCVACHPGVLDEPADLGGDPRVRRPGRRASFMIAQSRRERGGSQPGSPASWHTAARARRARVRLSPRTDRRGSPSAAATASSAASACTSAAVTAWTSSSDSSMLSSSPCTSSALPSRVIREPLSSRPSTSPPHSWPIARVELLLRHRRVGDALELGDHERRAPRRPAPACSPRTGRRRRCRRSRTRTSTPSTPARASRGSPGTAARSCRRPARR